MKRLACLLLFCAVAGARADHRAVVAALVRGPYLQNATRTSVTVAWKTDVAVPCTLRSGRFAGPPWESEVSTSAGTIHVAVLGGLRPDTRYEYEIEADGILLTEGPDFHFRTSPPSKSPKPFRFAAWGDSGTGNWAEEDVAANLDAVRPRPDFALGLGDLVYPSGEWANYDPRYFQPFRKFLRNRMIWTALGNHDTYTENGAPYLANFYLPTGAGASGHPSNTERYYSFDHGSAHFVALDTQSSSLSPTGPMLQWLADDLADADARGMRWKFVFAHHPPYTKGTHNSDTESQLVTIRQNVVPVLEQYGVDMFLAGHSHNYERSYLAKNGAVLQGDPDEYAKIGTPQGTIYLVSGCGGQSGSGPLNHPLMAFSRGNITGFTVIDVTPAECRGSFLLRDGTTIDLFTLRKGADQTPPAVRDVVARHPREVRVTFDEPVNVADAEAAANYALSGAQVKGVRLLSDGRTAVLSTTEHSLAGAHTLTVANVRDRALSPNTIAPGTKTVFVVERARGIEPHASWRFFEGTTDPGGGWKGTSFDDSAWPEGPAGFGYGDGDDATFLGSMGGQYLTVYLRRLFTVFNAASVAGLTLRLRYDDGFVAYLNGVEVARKYVPSGQTYLTAASSSHEAGGFESFDLSAAIPLLANGTNVLAVEGHNRSYSSSDFTLHPELVIEGGMPVHPVAILKSDVHAGNAPLTVAVSGEKSFDPGGGALSMQWYFGDGSGAQAGEQATHAYATPGSYLLTLVVTNAQGRASLARKRIFVHAVGSAPVAEATAKETTVDPGQAAKFSAVGSGDPDGGAVDLHWDFGDPASGPANVSSGAQAEHAFLQAGVYSVTLTVTDDEGSQAAKVLQIAVGQTAGSTEEAPPAGGGGCRGGEGAGSIAPMLLLLAVLAALAARHRPQSGHNN